ncbi:hypothetical protein [Saccharothrix luteola]|uniref:hypothetical protein n=1 Tax=Saccharothrix luteola TaxID=2893018 RepID=UPI001E449B01|nr:hypothetical protein [Saccharothrix luteola]MCC8251208.1 hypothetical protein [Saccharothrix luteola]
MAERHGDGLDPISVNAPFALPAPAPEVWQPTASIQIHSGHRCTTHPRRRQAGADLGRRVARFGITRFWALLG